MSDAVKIVKRAVKRSIIEDAINDRHVNNKHIEITTPEEEVISVMIVMFPDGTEVWFESNEQFAKSCIKEWSKKQPEKQKALYKKHNIQVLVGQLKMFRKDAVNAGIKLFSSSMIQQTNDHQKNTESKKQREVYPH